MGFYNFQSNIFINNTQNPSVKINDIVTSINTLHDILLTGELVLPRLDNEFIEMLYNLDFTYYNMFTDFYQKEIVNGVQQKVGFNPAQIASTSKTNISSYLEEIDDTYRLQIIQLDQLYRRLNKNMNHHKLACYLFNDIEQEFVTNQDLTKFKFTTKTFESIFRKDPYVGGALDSKGMISIPYIISYMILFRLYSKSFNFPSVFLDDAYRNSFFSDSRIPAEFSNYLTTYGSEFSSDLASYMLNNIFLFGTNIAVDIHNTLSSAILDMLPTVSQIFTDIKGDVVTTDFIFTLASEFSHQLASQSALKYLNDDFYLSLDQFFEIDSDALNYYSIAEDEILTNCISYINTNLGTANELASMALTYTSQPLFFLNTFMLTYSQFTLNFIQDSDCFALNDVKSWLSRFYTFKSDGLPNLLQYLKDHPLYYPGELFDHGCTGCTGGVGSFGSTGYEGCTGSQGGTGDLCVPIERIPGPGDYNTCLKLSVFLKFRTIILNFCNSDEFKDFITKTFIRKASKAINEKYFIEVDWYMEIDKIISFFKILLLKYVSQIDSSTGKYKLWGKFIDDFDVHVTQHLHNSSMTLTSGVLQNILDVDKQSGQTYYYIFNSFMKSSAMSRYLEKQLKKNYSL